MPIDLDHQVGAPRLWRFAGRDWQVSGLTPYQMGRLTARLKDLIPHPLEAVKAFLKDGVFTGEERKALLDEARAECRPRYETRNGRAIQVGGWPPSFGSAAANEVLFYGEGIAYFLWVILAKHHPDLTLEEAGKLAAHFGNEELVELVGLIGLPTGDGEGDGEGAESDAEGDGLPAGYVDPKA